MRTLSNLPRFKFSFYVQEGKFFAEVHPQQMVVFVVSPEDVSAEIRFSIDEKRGVAVVTDARMLEGRCGEFVDPERVAETLQQFLTRHFFCPECQHCADEKPRFEDNGCATSSVDYGQLCTKCGTTWAPNFV